VIELHEKMPVADVSGWGRRNCCDSVGRALGRRALALAAALAVLAGVYVAAAPARSPTATAASPSVSPSTDTTEPVPEVTITSRRALAPKVSKFVDQIVDMENAEGIPLWKVPVCAMVFGLSPEQRGFILERLADIANAANVPLGGGYCDPNLFIVVTDDPKGLLRGWDDRSPTRMEVFGGASEDLFAGAPQSVIDEFIATPRAVRVWYFTRKEDAWGLPTSAQISPYAPAEIHAEASRIVSHNMAYVFFRVFVIADQTRLHGLTIDQLADYFSMVGLAKLKSGAKLGGTPTILKLFDGPPAAAPVGMSAWDQAFLKSLYASEQRSTLQRRQIASAIVREIVP
jgi:hypothetical protein